MHVRVLRRPPTLPCLKMYPEFHTGVFHKRLQPACRVVLLGSNADKILALFQVGRLCSCHATVSMDPVAQVRDGSVRRSFKGHCALLPLEEGICRHLISA